MAVQYPNMTPEWARWHMQRTMQPQTATPLATPLPAEWSWGSQQAIGPTPSIPAPITDFGAGVSARGSGMDLPFQNLNYVKDSAAANSDTDLSKAPAKTPTTTPQPGATPSMPGQQQNSTYTPVPKSTWEDWLNQSGNLGGQTWDGTRWTGGGPVAAGTYIMGNSGIRTWVNYDARRDTALNEFNGVANSESNWHKVNRYAMDYVNDHGMQPQEAYNKALSRLKSEYVATGRDLATSGFDMSNVPLLNQAPGQQPTTPSRGGGTTDAPYTPPGTPPPPPAPGTAPATTPPLPGTGGGTTGGGNPNQTFLDDAAVAWTASHPDEAIQAIRSVRGGKDRSGPLGAYRESSMGQALQAYLSMYGVGGNDAGHNPLANANQGIQEMIARMNSGQGVGGFLREAAGKMMNGLNYEGLDNSQIMDILGTAGGAGMFGYSPLAQQRMKNELEDMQGRAYDQSRTGVDPTHAILASRQGRGGFDDILARYLAMQQGR